ncbi:MAG: HPP family protein [Lachnospira sp.]|nr:HPP family protein [Lachnospira sp.]
MNTKINVTMNTTMRIILAFIMICGMIGVSEFLNEPEIIFPEIAAIVVGSLIAPHFSWNTSEIKIFASIAICAVLGVLIVYFLPGYLWFQITIAYFLGQCVYILMRTTFVPMISAIVLPVLLQTKNLIYIASALILTALILLIRVLIEKCGMVEKQTYEKTQMWTVEDLGLMLVRVACVGIFSLAAVSMHWKFMVAPPLLVAFTGFCNPMNPMRKKPVNTVLQITICALVGAVCRWGLTIQLGLPLALAAAVSLAIVLVMMMASHTYIPPAGAMMALAMLIPEAMVISYPLQVLIGVTVMMAVSIVLFAKSE